MDDDSRISDRVSKVSNNLQEGIVSAREKVSDFAGNTLTMAAGAGNSIRDAAIEAGNKVSDVAVEAHKQGVKAGDYLSETTREQPLLSLLLAAAVGYAVAYLLHQR